MFSKSCEYGIRAALLLASREDSRRFTPIKEISEVLDISYHFLTKTLQKLTEDGLLTSYRGPRGGVRLALPADDISIKDIVVSIDGPDLFEQCVLGLPGCGCGTPCPMHEQWSSTRDAIEDQFENNSLGQLSEKIQSSQVRLTIEDLTSQEDCS